MNPMLDTLKRRLQQAGQSHVLKWCDTRSADERRNLVQQLESLDLDLLRRLYAERDQQSAVPVDDRIAPIRVTAVD
ncbi:MAG TPA: hypothetical protein VE988_20895, partial [Gemmataceae bacterium]|nr:hypothetical protein [Gemmataceae bacterium]